MSADAAWSVLPRRPTSPTSLTSPTGAMPSTQGAIGAAKQRSVDTKQQIHPHACPANCRTTGAMPAAQGAISHSRACFASEKRGECTVVLDPSVECCKARSGTARSHRILEKRHKKWRRESESNRSKRFCRPLPNLLAITPRDSYIM